MTLQGTAHHVMQSYLIITLIIVKNVFYVYNYFVSIKNIFMSVTVVGKEETQIQEQAKLGLIPCWDRVKSWV